MLTDFKGFKKIIPMGAKQVEGRKISSRKNRNLCTLSKICDKLWPQLPYCKIEWVKFFKDIYGKHNLEIFYSFGKGLLGPGRRAKKSTFFQIYKQFDAGLSWNFEHRQVCIFNSRCCFCLTIVSLVLPQKPVIISINDHFCLNWYIWH